MYKLFNNLLTFRRLVEMEEIIIVVAAIGMGCMLFITLAQDNWRDND